MDLRGEGVFRVWRRPSPQERDLKCFEIYEHTFPFRFPVLIDLVGANVVSHSDEDAPYPVLLTPVVAPTIRRKQPGSVPLFGESSFDVITLVRVEADFRYGETMQSSGGTLIHDGVGVRQAVRVAEREGELRQESVWPRVGVDPLLGEVSFPFTFLTFWPDVAELVALSWAELPRGRKFGGPVLWEAVPELAFVPHSGFSGVLVTGVSDPILERSLGSPLKRAGAAGTHSIRD